MIIDTHSHCYWETLEPRIDEVVSNMQKNGVTQAIQIGCDVASSQKAIALARRFPGTFFATVGYHPEEAQNQEIGGKEMQELEELIIANRDVIVGIGETGLDYHYLEAGKEEFQKANQRVWWTFQWELAQKYSLPLIIHTRDARDDTLSFIQENDIHRCVMHCFSEDWDFAEKLLAFSEDIYFSFSGILTYKSTPKIQEAATKIPLNRILLETDAPFLSPQEVRGTVNEPANTVFTFEKLCTLRTESREEIKNTIYMNSKRFYGI